MTVAAPLLPDAVSAIVEALGADLHGIVDDSSLARAQYATDASNYRVVLEVVVIRRTRQDVVEAALIARNHGMAVTVLGDGNSCAGNAVVPGMVLDFSRFFNRIVSIDPETRTAVVEPGVVLSDLQAAAVPLGLRFGPDSSTATRCTTGGMIGNNACGPHGPSYGRTADNVRSLTWVTSTGKVITAGSGSGPEGWESVEGLDQFIVEYLVVLCTQFGRFDRQVSGCSMEHLLPENGRNLAAALTGTEGSCGIILEAELTLVPLEPAPALAVLGYTDMGTAADDVPALLPLRPLALEGLDAQLVDVIHRAKGPDSVPELPRGGG